jgi:hypothetical protein
LYRILRGRVKSFAVPPRGVRTAVALKAGCQPVLHDDFASIDAKMGENGQRGLIKDRMK